MSLRTRAIIAVLLMIGFYIFSIAVSGLLLFIPYLMYEFMDRMPIKIAFACVVAACAILWSLIPRRDKFEAPGPLITDEQHPRLFAEIRDIAQRTGQEMPAEVYLVPEINAWVTQRGGTMGFGSRRVMGLGVPLMGLLTVSQFRAVLAHEFGHYYGGDTKLGPWIYQTRAAIVRTVQSLAESGSWAVYLFTWYAKFFVRVTHAISRAQEYAADRLGAQIAGAKALIDGLKQIHVGSAAWQAYLQSEVAPVLSAGYAPPLAKGFSHFLGSVREATNQILAKEMAEGKADPYDTHPALPERIAAIEKMESTATDDQRLALDLLENPTSIDCSLFQFDYGTNLRPVTWDQVVTQVWIPTWQKAVAPQTEAIGDMTIGELAEQLSGSHLGRRLKYERGVWKGESERHDHATGVGMCALSLALLREGWTAHALPGEMYFEKEGKRLDPLNVVPQLAAGKITAEDWQKQCADFGIADIKLVVDAAATA